MNLARIARHERRLLTADRTAAVVGVVLAVLFGYAALNGSAWAGGQHRTVAALGAEETARFDSLAVLARAEAGTAAAGAVLGWGPRHPAFLGRSEGRPHAALPPAALAALSVGQSDLYPLYVVLTTDRRQASAVERALENPLKLLAGRFDLAFVLVFLYPLFVLALTYDVMAREREGGTLRLLLAQPVRLRQVVAGKVAVRFGFLSACAAGLTLLAAVLAGLPLGESGVAGRLALWIAAALVYGAFWVALAVAVNARGWSSATNAVALAACWLLFVVVVPSLVNLAAASVYPAPSRAGLVEAAREATREVDREASALLDRFYQDHPEFLAAGDAVIAREEFAVRRAVTEERIEARIRPVAEAHEAQLARQQRFARGARYLSPALLVQDVFNDLAGTGHARRASFERQVEAYHGAWRGFFLPRVRTRTPVEDYGAVPRFAFAEERTADVFGRVAAPLFALTLLTALVGTLGLLAYRRYPLAD